MSPSPSSEKMEMTSAALVEEFLGEDVADPHDMASAALERYGWGELEPVLIGALAAALRIAITRRRRRPRLGGGEREGLGSAVHRAFSTPEYVDGRWTPLGDLTAEQVETVAGDRYALAHRILDQGDRRRRLAAVMRQRGAERVRDLDEATFSAVML